MQAYSLRMRHRQGREISKERHSSPVGFEKLEYEERLKRISLTTLKDRRARDELIEMLKVMSSRESINWVKTLNLRKKYVNFWTDSDRTRKYSKHANRVI